MDELLDDEIEADLIDEYETYYTKQLYIHQRFAFFNKLMEDLKVYKRANTDKKNKDFIKDKWTEYITEFAEFSDYSDLAKEYLIKKCLYKLINSKNNINKIVERR